MDTYFAPAQRSTPEELQANLALVSRNPVIDSLLKVVSGLLAVLDEHRQILAVNDALLEMLGLKDVQATIGLRPGEAIACVHAHEAPAGCGTTKYCSTCGAAIAMVSSLADDLPKEEICAATVNRNGANLDLCFTVRSVPIRFAGQRLLLLFMQDITHQQNLAFIERTFFHDINNLLSCLLGAAECISYSSDPGKMVAIIEQSARRLKSEIDIHRTLATSQNSLYKPSLSKVRVTALFAELKGSLENHPAAQGKLLTILPPLSNRDLLTDSSLLLRILTNMLTNAFEATAAGGEIKLWTEPASEQITFCVWNNQAIPEPIALRIFQRNFSTKGEAGHGLGTYSMKLLGENILKGTVGFTSSPTEGTTFRLTIPGLSPLVDKPPA